MSFCNGWLALFFLLRVPQPSALSSWFWARNEYYHVPCLAFTITRTSCPIGVRVYSKVSVHWSGCACKLACSLQFSSSISGRVLLLTNASVTWAFQNGTMCAGNVSNVKWCRWYYIIEPGNEFFERFVLHFILLKCVMFWWVLFAASCVFRCWPGYWFKKRQIECVKEFCDA